MCNKVERGARLFAAELESRIQELADLSAMLATATTSKLRAEVVLRRELSNLEKQDCQFALGDPVCCRLMTPPASCLQGRSGHGLA